MVLYVFKLGKDLEKKRGEWSDYGDGLIRHNVVGGNRGLSLILFFHVV